MENLSTTANVEIMEAFRQELEESRVRIFWYINKYCILLHHGFLIRQAFLNLSFDGYIYIYIYI